MPDDADSSSISEQGSLPSILNGMSPDELFARGMQSARMTGGGSLQSWEPPSLDEACRLFPNYEVTEMIGRGGMGVVYKGRQVSLDRVVAIKLLPLEVSIDRDFGDRFVREAQTMAKMNHPNIVLVFDFGKTTEGHLYFVMEFVEGTTLHHLIKTAALNPTQSLEIIVRVCEALQYAHTEGVIHRDIKPANILVDTKGRVKVTDFGLARMDNSKTPEQWGQTMTGMILGTPDYMAPEQKKGIRVDHRADIYSLGVMLYEMLCGEIPAGIFDPPSQRVAVDERIDQVVIRAMQQEPNRRYPSTGEMQTAVESIRSTPLPHRIPDPPFVSEKKPRLSSRASREAMQPEFPAEVHSPKQFGTLIAAGCAVVAVAMLAWNQFSPKSGKGGAEEMPRNREAPETTANSIKPDVPVPSSPVLKADPPSLSAPEGVDAPRETPREPVVPIPAPPAERPIPVSENPPPVAPPGVQVSPPAILSGAPGITVPSATPPLVNDPSSSIEAEILPHDWVAFVATGDNCVRRRQFDEAIEAYTEAMDAAQANPKGVSPEEFCRVCKSLGSLQISHGSAAEARRTLTGGRQFLLKVKASPSTVSQVEAILKKLPRD
jgi:serine/threonine protein kinase